MDPIRSTERHIPVFFSINDSYAPHLCTALASILANSKAVYDFYVLSTDITVTTQQKIRSMNKLRPFNIEFIKIDPSIFGNLTTQTISYISIEACYRLMIPTLKPDLNKALYLDSDLVVLEDLQQLWDTDLGNAFCGAIEDYTPYETESRKRLFDGMRYLNSGVLVLNLARIRQSFALEDYLAIEKKYHDDIILQDQDILNLAYNGHVKYIPRKWNTIYVYIDSLLESCGGVTKAFRVKFEQPAICHFAGSQKPWVAPYGITAQYYARKYFKYLRLTPYAELETTIYNQFPAWRILLRKLTRHPKFIFRKTYWRRRQFRAYYENGSDE